MSKRKLVTLVLSAALVLVLGGTYTWAYLTGKISPSASEVYAKKEVKITSYDFVPGEIIVKVNSSKAKNLKSRNQDTINPKDTGIKSISKLNEKYQAKEAKLVLKPSAKTPQPELEKAHLSDIYKISYEISKEDLEKEIRQDSEQGRLDQDLPEEVKKKMQEQNPDLFAQNQEKSKVTVAHLKTAEIINELNKLSEVDYAEPNYIFRTTAFPETLPNDTYIDPDQNNTWSTGAWSQSYEDMWGLKKIEADKAWAISQGEGVKVAVIDTGVDYYHEDIKDNILTTNDGSEHVVGYDFANEDPDPMDDYGHGTHVAGTIAATGNNGKGIIGVAPKAKIMPIKFMKHYPDGYYGTDLNGFYSIIYAVDNGARVINTSWGGESESPPQLLQDAINYAYDKNVVFIAAAGNSHADIANFYPASLEHVISVGSSTINDDQSWFSNKGLIDVVAPGGTFTSGTNVDILSLRADSYGLPGYVLADRYYRNVGTSMAAPHVSGLAAMIIKNHSEWSPDQVRSAIDFGADDKGSVGFDPLYGYGRINLLKALQINDPPLLDSKITVPLRNANMADNSVILGTAAGEDFSYYKLEYVDCMRLNNYCWLNNDWQEIKTSDSPVYEGELGVLNTTSMRFFIKLSVFDNQNHARVSYVPAINMAGLEDGWPVNLQTGRYPAGSFTVDDLNNDGQKEIIFAANTIFNAFLTVLTPQGNPFSQNFPIPLTVPLMNTASAPSTFDLDNDGEKEIIIVESGALGYYDNFAWKTIVHIYKLDGSELTGWPKQLDGLGSTPWSNNLMIGDVNGDGLAEIIFYHQNKIYVWDKLGNDLPGWPLEFPNNSPQIKTISFSLADINKDNKLEIIAADSEFKKVHVLDHLAHELPHWPQDLGDSWSRLNPIIGDINNDGNLEIVISQMNDGRLRVFSSEGNALWDKGVGGHYDNFILADLDGDKNLEIIGGTDYDSYNKKLTLHAWHYDGQEINTGGWPVSISGDPQAQYYNINFKSSLIAADIDDDNKSEIFAIVHEWNSDNVYERSEYIYAWEHNGGLLNGFPKGPFEGFEGHNMPTVLIVSDVDSDKKLELGHADNTGMVYLWELANLVNNPRLDWPMYRHDPQHTGAYPIDLTGITNPTHSQISTDSGQVQADGVKKAKITVTLKDFQDNPVANKNVVISSSRPGDVIVQPNDAGGGGLTNDQGQTFGYVSSTTVGSSEISAVDITWSENQIALANKVSVEFVPTGAPIALYNYGQGNIISFPYSNPQVYGWTKNDHIYKAVKAGFWTKWQEITLNQVQTGIAYKITANQNHKIYIQSGVEASSPQSIPLTYGDNYLGDPFKTPVPAANITARLTTTSCRGALFWKKCTTQTQELLLIQAVGKKWIDGAMQGYNLDVNQSGANAAAASNKGGSYSSIKIGSSTQFLPYAGYKLKSNKDNLQLIFKTQ